MMKRIVDHLLLVIVLVHVVPLMVREVVTDRITTRPELDEYMEHEAVKFITSHPRICRLIDWCMD